MSFDINNAADLLTLKNEVNNDPIGMGYDPSGNTPSILSLLNDPSKNVGGETTGKTLTVKLLLDAIEPGDLTIGGQFSQGKLEWLKMVVESSTDINSVIESQRVKITNLFQAQDVTRTMLEAQSRTLSRAEVIFSENTNISRTDWIAARDS